MAEENEHSEKLIAAREREVGHRRNVVGALAEAYRRDAITRKICVRPLSASKTP
jgi:hypothetical protein